MADFARIFRPHQRKRHIVIIVTGCLALCATLLLVPRDYARHVALAFDAVFMGTVQNSFSERMLEKSGPVIHWINFDERSQRAAGAAPHRPAIRHTEVARLLRLIEKAEKPPALVYVDINLFRDETQLPDSALRSVLQNWSGPPLGLDAGSACLPKRNPTAEFRPQALIDNGGKRIDLQRRLFWTCPVFDGDVQFEYSCVRTGKTGAALPSPAWFADAVHQARGSALEKKLKGLDKGCRTIREPTYSEIPVPNGGQEQLYRVDVDGLSLITKHNAVDFARSLTIPSSFAGNVIVIGGNAFADDDQYVHGNSYPGTMIVGVALRTALVSGLPQPSSRLAEIAVATAIALLLYIAAMKLEGHNDKRLKPKSFWRFFATSRLLPVILALSLPFVLARFFNPALLLSIVLGVIVSQVMIWVENLWREWHELSTAR